MGKRAHMSEMGVAGMLAVAALLGGGLSLSAADLREATFTEVVNTVNVTNPENNATRPAQTNTKFATPELIRTGVESRAELTAADQTVTRVGSNTIFSFKPQGRGINLHQGSVLFNSPTGRGGGTIQTAAATATVLGTTIIVSTTSNGGFKLLVLEGKAKVTLPSGRSMEVYGGQMTFVVPGMKRLPMIFEFRLDRQREGSLLMGGFSQPLPSQMKVEEAIATQERMILSGRKEKTELLIGEVVNGNEVQIIDANTIEYAMSGANGTLSTTLSGTPSSPSTYSALTTSFMNACGVNANVMTSTLNSSNVLYFSSPTLLQDALDAVGSTLQISSIDSANTFNVFPGKNLNFLSGSVDLSPYTGSDAFVFFGKDSLLIANSINFSSYPGDVLLVGDTLMSVTSGSIVSFDARMAEMVCNGVSGLTLSNPILNNGSGVMYVSATSGPLTITNGSITGVSLLVSGFAGPGISVSALDDLTIVGTTFHTSGTYSGAYARVGVYMACGGNVLVDGITYSDTTHDLKIAGFASSSSPVGGTVTFMNNTLSVNAFDIYSTGSITSSANLITATDVNWLTTSGGIASDTDTVTASGTVTYQTQANAPVTLTNAAVQAANINVVGSLSSAVIGTVNLVNGTFTASSALNVAATDVNVNGTNFNGGGTGTASFIGEMTPSSSTLSHAITMNNASFNGLTSVAMQAYTINLKDVAFGAGSTVNLTSGLANPGGVPTFGASNALPGRVNFWSGVTYGGLDVNTPGGFATNGGNIHLN